MKSTALRLAFPLLLLVTLAVFGYTRLSSAAPAEKKPTVLVMYADWCPSCQQLKPVLALINEKYRNKIRFVRFDITSEETSAKSKEQAEKLGFADFFEKNKERTSLVSILDPSGREVFRTINDYEPEHYETILDRLMPAPQGK
jgi:thiol-disulfide isomerase/thioredoxin